MKGIYFLDQQGSISLVDRKFNELKYPVIEECFCTKLLVEILARRGFFAKHIPDSSNYEVVPIFPRREVIKAPLFKKEADVIWFVKNYSVVWIHPSEYINAKNALRSSIQETELLEIARFEGMFNAAFNFKKEENENFKMEAVLTIVYKYEYKVKSRFKQVFFNKYIPSDYVEVSSYIAGNYQNGGHKKALYIKRINAEKKSVYIKIPWQFKALGLIKREININRLKEELNASKVVIV